MVAACPTCSRAIAGGTWVKGDPRALALFVMTGGFDSARAQGQRGRQRDAGVPAAARTTELAGILTYIREKFGDGASAGHRRAMVAAARATLPPK